MSEESAQEAYRQGADQLEMNQLDPAIASFGRAIKRDPTMAAAYMGRAQAFATKGDIRQALHDWGRVMALSASPEIQSNEAIDEFAKRAAGTVIRIAREYDDTESQVDQALLEELVRIAETILFPDQDGSAGPYRM
ncbi:MAG: hypothetical protein R6V19_09890 [Armatimonadota bacterium]